MLKKILSFAFLSLFAAFAHAASITYEIYALNAAGQYTLVSKGVKHPTAADVLVQASKTPEGEAWWRKEIELDQGFSMGISIFREPEITGIGLWADSTPQSFSWEWFDRASGVRFEKLQETGQISVQYRSVGTMQEISKVTFDTDVALRLDKDRNSPDSHRIVIKKGSEFELPLSD